MVTRFPSVIVPVCVVKGVSAAGVLKLAPCVTETPCVEETPSMIETPCVSGVVASVPGCVLPSTPCMSEQPGENEAPRVREAACARETARVSEQPCVSERPSVRETACVRSLYVREMAVGMREGTTACPSAMVECPLEADRDEESPVEPCELEGASAVDGCTRSLGVWRPREPLW